MEGCSRIDITLALLQANLLPSLLSLSNFAKNNSLGSFNSHNLADLSTLPSVPGDKLISGTDSKGRGNEGKGFGAGPSGHPSGQAPNSPGRGGPGVDLTEWGQQRNARESGNGNQDAAGPSGRGIMEGEKEEDSEQYLQGLFWKQLQQQRQQQQQQKRENGTGTERQEHGLQESLATAQAGLGNPRPHTSSHAAAHFTQLQRDGTPPGSPYNEPNQAWGRPPSSSPRHEPDQAWSRAPSSSPGHELDQARARPPGDTHRDPRNSNWDHSSPRHEPNDAQGRASSGSPRHEQGRAKPSTFLSELAQAIEPAAKGKNHRYFFYLACLYLN